MSIKRIVLCCTLLVVLSYNSFAANLLEVYQQAITSDPSLNRAAAVKKSTQEVLPQNRASLLPNLALSANSTANRIDNQPESAANTQSKGNTHGYTVSLNQPLLNLASWQTLQQAHATYKQADAIYAIAQQDLLLRVSKAYLAVLLAQDKLSFILAQKAAISHQLEQTQARYQVGLETKTSVDEAQAAFDTSVAQEIAAKDGVDSSYEQLQTLTGKRYAQLATFNNKLSLPAPKPLLIQEWLEKANQQNLSLRVERYALQAARENLKSKQATHLPTLNIVGAYQDTQGNLAVVQGTRSDTKTSSIGLQLNLPIYQGGLVQSTVRQANADYQAASSDLEATYRQVTANTRQTFNSLIAGLSQLKADQQAILSSQSAVDSTQAAFKVGTRTIVDVLNAQQALRSAQIIYAEDEYNYILNSLQLKQLAGTLTVADLELVNSWLQTSQG